MYLRNSFAAFGIVCCSIAAANMFFGWYYYPVLQSYITTAPFIIGFNFHVLLKFIEHWHERFEFIEKSKLQEGLKSN